MAVINQPEDPDWHSVERREECLSKLTTGRGHGRQSLQNKPEVSFFLEIMHQLFRLTRITRENIPRILVTKEYTSTEIHHISYYIGPFH